MSNIVIEEEHGTSRSTLTAHHPHNGYSAGSFSASADPADLALWFSWGTKEATRPSQPGH
jgi:hypothetical protein